MSTSPESGSGELTRKEVLDAIDSEISHREASSARHGISTWSFAAVFFALLWKAATEISSSEHGWSVVVLVMLAGKVCLAHLAVPWLKAIGWGLPLELSNRPYTIGHQMLRHGVDPDSLLYPALECALMLCAGVYLILEGFVLVGAVTSGVNLFVILLVAFVWVLSRVKLPLTLSKPAQAPKRGRAVVLGRTLGVLVAVVPFYALLDVWPVKPEDLRLGLILAGVTFLYGISVAILPQPTTARRLRSVRSELAFGIISAEKAKRDAERIVHGLPAEHYVTKKADVVREELLNYIKLCDSIGAEMERIVVLAEKLPVAGSDQNSLTQIISEFQSLTRKLLRKTKDLPKRLEAAAKLRSELVLRMDFAREMLEIDPNALNAILESVDEVGRSTTKAGNKLADTGKAFKPAVDALFEAQKGVPGRNKKVKMADVYALLFRD